MIHLIVADETYLEDVSELLADLFEEVGHHASAADIAEVFEMIDSDDRHATLLALNDDGQAVGVLTLAEIPSLYAGGYVGVINELYVVPNYRSEGVGKILLDAAKALAEDRNWQRLEVTTPGDEYEKTLRFYEREGFMPIGPRYKFIIGQ